MHQKLERIDARAGRVDHPAPAITSSRPVSSRGIITGRPACAVAVKVRDHHFLAPGPSRCVSEAFDKYRLMAPPTIVQRRGPIAAADPAPRRRSPLYPSMNLACRLEDIVFLV